MEVARIRILAKDLGISSVIGQGDVVNFKFQSVDDDIAALMVKAKALYQRQLLVPATNIPTFILKIRGEGYKMLGRIRRFLGELGTLHETQGVV